MGVASYLNSGDVEWRGDTKDGHDDRLVLLVNEDLHFSDVFFSGHLRDVLIRHVRFSGPERKTSRVTLNEPFDVVSLRSVPQTSDVVTRVQTK